MCWAAPQTRSPLLAPNRVLNQISNDFPAPLQAQEEVDRVLGDRSKPNMGERSMAQQAQRNAVQHATA